jgi:hypothetical protein
MFYMRPGTGNEVRRDEKENCANDGEWMLAMSDDDVEMGMRRWA